MPFSPQVDSNLQVGDQLLRFAAHPTARGMPHGLEGREATVYELAGGHRRWALKVFKPRYRLKQLVESTEQLRPLAAQPGLLVCDRLVLSPHDHRRLVNQQPDLSYAVLMPWIEGPTWWDAIMTRRSFDRLTSLRLAQGLANVLARMEANGQSHCDLSGPNVLLPGLVHEEMHPVQLVDVEQMCVPGFLEPPDVAAGSPGYAHPSGTDGSWGPLKDRFAGAILISEILGWSDPAVREASSRESFFDQAEIQTACPRCMVIRKALNVGWGDRVARCFDQAWGSPDVNGCAPFSEWAAAIYEQAEQEDLTLQPSLLANRAVMALLATADRFERRGERAAAVEVLAQAQRMAVPDSLDWKVVTARTKALQQGPGTQTRSIVNSSSSADADGGLIPWSQVSSGTTSSASAIYIAAFAAVAVVLALATLVLAPTLNSFGAQTTSQVGATLAWALASMGLACLIGIAQAVGFRKRLAPQRRIAFVVISALAGGAGGLVAGWLWSSGIIPDARSGAVLGALAGLIASLGHNSLIGGRGGGAKWVVWSTISAAGIWYLATSITWNLSYTAAIGEGAVGITLLTGLAHILFLQVAREVEF